jgi:hypothetical protein
MMEMKNLVRFRVLEAPLSERQAYYGFMGTATLLSGRFRDEIVVKSDKVEDLWVLRECLFFGVGKPTDVQTHKDGKYLLYFQPVGQVRQIEDGEEFTEYADSPLMEQSI